MFRTHIDAQLTAAAEDGDKGSLVKSTACRSETRERERERERGRRTDGQTDSGASVLAGRCKRAERHITVHWSPSRFTAHVQTHYQRLAATMHSQPHISVYYRCSNSTGSIYGIDLLCNLLWTCRKVVDCTTNLLQIEPMESGH